MLRPWGCRALVGVAQTRIGVIRPRQRLVAPDFGYAGAVGHDGLRTGPSDDLFVELGRVGRLLQKRAETERSHPARDHAADALRARERAVVAEMRQRPGGLRLWTSRARGSGSA